VSVSLVCAGTLSIIDSVQAEHLMPPHRPAKGFALLNTAQGLGFGVAP
jgi:hypothetical protein